jgi:cytochrome d ubiquinol oxidase subunit II
MHGALFLRMKTEGPVHDRAEALGRKLWVAVVVVGLPMSAATMYVMPRLYEAMALRPLAWILTLGNVVALVAIPVCLKRSSVGGPFFASSALIVSSLATVATGMYPLMLRSTIRPENDLTITSSAAGNLGLHVGLVFWLVAIALAIGYFIFLFRSFRGKVNLSEGHGE